MIVTPAATAQRTAALLLLVGCIACRRGDSQPALEIMNRPTAVSLAVGDTVIVRAVVAVTINEAPVTVSWSSDNEAIAQVDRNGHVTAVAPGVARITARIGTAFATTRVTVFAHSTAAPGPRAQRGNAWEHRGGNPVQVTIGH